MKQMVASLILGGASLGWVLSADAGDCRHQQPLISIRIQQAPLPSDDHESRQASDTQPTGDRAVRWIDPALRNRICIVPVDETNPPLGVLSARFQFAAGCGQLSEDDQFPSLSRSRNRREDHASRWNIECLQRSPAPDDFHFSRISDAPDLSVLPLTDVESLGWMTSLLELAFLGIKFCSNVRNSVGSKIV